MIPVQRFVNIYAEDGTFTVQTDARATTCIISPSLAGESLC